MCKVRKALDLTKYLHCGEAFDLQTYYLIGLHSNLTDLYIKNLSGDTLIFHSFNLESSQQ